MKCLLTILVLIVAAISVNAQAMPDVDGTQLPTEGYWLRIIPSQPEYGLFNFTYKPFNVNGETQQDHVLRFGWNCAGGGGPAVSGKGAFCQEHESHYRPGGAGDPRKWSEWHLAGIDEVGNVSRAISIMHDKPTGNITTHIKATNLSFIDGFDHVNFQMFAGKLIFQNGVTIRSVDNNAPIISQYNTLGVPVSLIRIDDADRVLLGNGTYPAHTGPLSVNGDIEVSRVKSFVLYYTKSVSLGTPDDSKQILGDQCPAIPDSTSTFDTQRAINDLLLCLRSHGLIAAP